MMSKGVNEKSAPSSRKLRRRVEILHVATRLFAESGYTDCEMERVASASGVAKGTLYLYFASKQELFFACVDQGMQELQATLDVALADIIDPVQGIAGSIWAFLKFFDENPQHIELLIQERAIFRDRKQPTFFKYREARRDRWFNVYNDLVSQGRFRKDVPVVPMLETVGNLLYGTMFTNYFEGRSGLLCSQYAALIEISFRGVLSPEERERLTGQNLAQICPPANRPSLPDSIITNSIVTDPVD